MYKINIKLESLKIPFFDFQSKIRIKNGHWHFYLTKSYSIQKQRTQIHEEAKFSLPENEPIFQIQLLAFRDQNQKQKSVGKASIDIRQWPLGVQKRKIIFLQNIKNQQIQLQLAIKNDFEVLEECSQSLFIQFDEKQLQAESNKLEIQNLRMKQNILMQETQVLQKEYDQLVKLHSMLSIQVNNKRKQSQCLKQQIKLKISNIESDIRDLNQSIREQNNKISEIMNILYENRSSQIFNRIFELIDISKDH